MVSYQGVNEAHLYQGIKALKITASKKLEK